MDYKIKSGSGFVISIDELGTPYMTTEKDEATVFDEFSADFAVTYLNDSGFSTQLIEV